MKILFYSSGSFAQIPTRSEIEKNYLGTWIGTIKRQAPDSTNSHYTRLIWRIHSFNIDKAEIYVTQIADYDKPKLRKHTAKFMIHGYVGVDETGSFLSMNVMDVVGKACEISFMFNLSLLGPTLHLNANFNKAEKGCYNVTMRLAKLDENTSELKATYQLPER